MCDTQVLTHVFPQVPLTEKGDLPLANFTDTLFIEGNARSTSLYDFCIVTRPSFDRTESAQPQPNLISLQRRAVCTKSGDVFSVR